MDTFLNAFFAMGNMAYVVIGIFILSAVFGVLSYKMNKGAREKWIAAHPGAVKVVLKAGTGIITQKSLYASVVRGEAAIFYGSAGYVVYAVPGLIELEVTYSYTRPGVLYKNVTTTWGPAKVELPLEPGKNYELSFDKKEEKFNLSAV